MKIYPYILCVFFLILSCNNDTKEAQEIDKITIDLKIDRFDVAFNEASKNNLPELKAKYPFMFPETFDDSFWQEQLKDTIQQELSTETVKAFRDLKAEEEEIKNLFKHLTYYFTEFKTPRVITTTSNVDYRNNVIVTDTITLISLDTYLGSEHYFYVGIQEYLRADFNREQIVVDMAGKYAEKFIFHDERKRLIDDMIYSGKALYFKDRVIPFKTDAQKIGYTTEQLEWAKANEAYIWRYFVDRELLFSTDTKLANRFINSAPFSKFYLEEIDNESPDKLGQYIGWQIVKSYMENNEVTFNQLLNKSSEDIFNNAKFKPSR
ncbi:gliding motility lipoprotein GldB [Bizionia gelidisalsuginis]|uniref:Gliding motility lipoprotein GldB n=1 Tax=Bizionia gelidisalsuginis TaxID=291188 RepID=A0ABY3MAD6_9FLAO|nr:gliding motility lipoprotein GldB [Bizionia gelidisalsuginis]TYC12716.1 gliding motility lipoprotein GldB [Bizionia gelidisalsuginis]